MCETFGQDSSRSVFERFHLFMNCCNMFFHVILDWKLNVSELAQTLATRIVWCCACVWDFWSRSVTFNFWVSFLDFASRNSKEDWKLNLSDAAQTLATRIVWSCADVWNFWTSSEAFNFWKVSPLHELLQRVLSCYSWLKIECLRTCWKFGYQNSLMLCLCVRLLGKIHDVPFLSFIFRFCFKKLKKKIENWISQTMLKLWLP